MDQNPSNPYAAPATVGIQTQVGEAGFAPASLGLRFANLVIDSIVAFVAIFLIGVLLAMLGLYEPEQKGTANLISYGVFFVYYACLEGLCGRTIGKFVTGTKVINERGGKPSFGQAAGRSLCRFIPFEAFSMFRSEHRGWHDSIPKTWVVNLRQPLG